MNLTKIFLVFFISISIFLGGCISTKKLKEDQILLNKNVIKSNNNSFNKDLQALIRQKPNRKILGLFRFHLAVYNMADKGKETKTKAWIKRTIGEEPVILDHEATKKSTYQLELFLHNKGYFNAVVEDSTQIKNKKARIYYFVSTKEPYIIKNVEYKSNDKIIYNIILSDKVNSVIKEGDIYDISVLQEERNRITKELQNRGYYNFNKEYIHYTIDSTLGSHQLNILLNIKQINEDSKASTNQAEDHKTYKINNVYIQTDYDPTQAQLLSELDTLSYKEYYFLYSADPLKFKPDIIIQSIFIKPKDIYQVNHLENTYKRLSDLGNFKFINISFEQRGLDSLSDKYLIDTYIQLTPSNKQALTGEMEWTHNGGDMGITVNGVYRNKNIFRGAEVLEIKLKGALEAQKTFVDTLEKEDQTLYLFNTFEIGPEVNLYFQQFLFPFKIKSISKYANPQTSLTSSYNLQKRPDYIRKIQNFSFGYNWQESQYKKHYVYPVEINFVKVNLDTTFEKELQGRGDVTLINSFKSHLITNSRWTFIYNTQKLNKNTNFIYFRSNIEFAGNILRLINTLDNSIQNKTGSYLIFGLKYAQYFKPDFDIRYYHIIDKNNTLVYRFNAGIGIPYGNSTVLPFEKSYFAGGTNGIRAWRTRTLGPGSYKDYTTDQTGDIKLEANIEYRGNIFRLLEGAIFADAGNIWLRNKDESRIGGKFEADKFLGEIAVGAGIGLRLNFNFFIFRIDGAVPIKDPSQPIGDRWVYDKIALKSIIFNFAIGYPF